MITLVLGGTRSGKSEVAEGLLPATGPVTYVATGQVTDPDMGGRIDVHRARRPGAWTTVEAGPDLVAVLDQAGGPVLVDSLGTWVAAHDDLAPDVAGARRRPPRPGRTGRGATVVVSEEVGLGVHPPTEVGRRFADALGRSTGRSPASPTACCWWSPAGSCPSTGRCPRPDARRARVPDRRRRGAPRRTTAPGVVRGGRRPGRPGRRRAVVGAGELWPPLLAAVLAVAVDAALTGMLHLDGLADTADGAAAPASTAARRLAVMAAPDVGAFGVAALVVVLARPGRGAGLARPRRGRWWPACGRATRAVMAVTLALVPYARAGRPRRPPSAGRSAAPAAVTAVAGAGGGRGRPRRRGPDRSRRWRRRRAASSAVVALARRRLGGFTGDVLGAAGVVAETVGLLVAAARW